jgi:ParB-like nuclease domain
MSDIEMLSRADDTTSILSSTAADTVLTGKRTGRFKRSFIPVKNEPGVLRKIDKRLIHVDPEYQRKLNERLVGRIVANWSWVSCGVIEVSQRSDSEMYFVIDGQHRWKAATYLSAIKELPCIVFALDTVMDEATGFLAANTERRLPTISDQFKALITTGDKTAIEAMQLAETYSRKIGAPADAQHISCVSDFLNCVNTNSAAMHRVFPVLARLCTGRPMTGRLIRGMHALERRMPKGESLADERWRTRLVRAGYDELIQSMKIVATLENRASERALAQGILRAINRNLRTPLTINLDVVRR